ncbi:MAG: hypothetical protein OJF58_001718 [Enhydrobacter sp.]|nr:MAG: hypothetical protein OJF58_001718 [Enhydrobacter sp.]
MYAAEQRCIKAEDQYDGDECACHDATYSAHVVGKNGSCPETWCSWR